MESGYFFVADCRWLWTDDWQDIYGIGIRTDITSDMQTTYHGSDLKKANQYRLAWQNLPDDIKWVEEKINWLWSKAFGSELPLVIEIDKKLELHEYIDLGDYM